MDAVDEMLAEIAENGTPDGFEEFVVGTASPGREYEARTETLLRLVRGLAEDVKDLRRHAGTDGRAFAFAHAVEDTDGSDSLTDQERNALRKAASRHRARG